VGRKDPSNRKNLLQGTWGEKGARKGKKKKGAESGKSGVPGIATPSKKRWGKKNETTTKATRTWSPGSVRAQTANQKAKSDNKRAAELVRVIKEKKRQNS